jgi:hypothetical protein
VGLTAPIDLSNQWNASPSHTSIGCVSEGERKNSDASATSRTSIILMKGRKGREEQ